uniref:PKD/REJ-like domain-containing protein n=1 Tax=Aureoumbra lagunensis TaxID=44058 RepID=A0A7S3JZP2_9STRA
MPTSYPTVKPSSPPSEIPTSLPTGVPIFVPTSYPTATPISIPSAVPTSLPSSFPTPFPTTHVPSSSRPTLTSFPTTFNPSLSPTAQGSSSIPSAPPTLSGESIVMGSFLLEGDMTASDVEENKDVFEYAIASSVGVDASTVDISVDEVRRRRLTSLEVTYIIRPSSSKVDSIMTALLTVESNDLETALITAQDAVGATIDMSLISIESMTTPVRMDTDYPSLLPTLLPCQNIDTIIEAPILKQAAFDKTGASLVLTFDVATDRASYLVGAEFPCSKVFDFTDAASSSCFWTTNQHLIADVSALTSLYPGDNVSLASDNTVKNECEDWIEQRCDCFASASSNYTITIELPSKILSPKVVLEGSSVANACEGLAIDSSASTGSGGREFIDYAWNVSAVAINASAARKVIATILSDAVQRQQGAYQFLLSSDEVTALYASSVEKLHVQLQITNFLGRTASADFTVTLSAETPPFLEVIGGLQQTARRPDPLSIRANAVATSCDGRPAISRGVELDWIFLARDESITNVGLSSTSSDPRLFQLPAYSLIAGASYLLEVTAIDKAINQTSQASCEVIVEHSSIVAVLNGGSDRIASLSEIITISAAASIDLDVETERGSAAGLSFEWNCSALQNTSNCSTFAIALNDDKWYQRESLIFNGSALGLGLFKFHVTVFSNNGRSDITSTLLKIVDDSPPIVEIVDFASSIVSVDSRLVVYSTSTPSSDFLTLATLHSSENVIFNTSWSLQSGSLAQGLKLEDWTTTKTFISAPTSVLSSNNEYQREHNLVLKSGSLVPGSYYTLRLEARLDGISTPGYAAISFKAAAAPSGGILEIKPAAGIALETLFTLTTRNWASDAFPLKYAFKVIDSEGVLSTLRTATSDLRLKDAILPAGTPNVTVQVIVYDSIGSMATQSRSVRCAQLDDLDALVNATQILLANMIALNSNEGIYQIVVAATHADATNSISGLSSVLTDAVATVVASQDADIELVEQAAVAIEEVFARSEFETATATTTLNIFQTLAETSAEIGITSISAETIGLGLSMMLDTPILGKNDSNMSAKFDASLAALMKAQRLNLLPDEDAILITTKNLRTAAARLEASSADSEERQVSCLDSETAVILPESLPGDDSYDISLVEFSVSPHSSIDTTTDTNDGVIRFSMEASSTSGRRMLEDSSATAQVDVLFGPTIAQHANALTSIPYATNVSCPCDYVGNVSVKCPSGAVVTRMCSGEPGTYNITCPRTLTSCLVWEDSLEKWGNAACSLSPSANGNKVSCSCSVTFGSTSDFGVSNAVLKSYAAYAANITQGVDPEKALYMFICIGLVLLLCFFLAWYGAQLDKKDAAMVADNPKPFISIRGQVTTVHGRHHIESRSHKDLARTGAKTEKIDTHPLFINERSRMRYVAALAHQHPLASWYFCYSPSASRVIRVIALGFELFFFMFVLACEVNLIYADPGCSKQTNRKDCLAFKKAFWAGGSDMCSWRNCKCQPDTPAFTTAATNPHHYLVLAIVLLLTFPVLRGFEYVFRHYLIAPLPPELKRLVRWYMGQRAQHAVHIDESEIKTVKNSNENDDDDERETEIVDMAAKRHQNHVQGTFWIARIVGRWRLRHLRQQKVKHTRRQSLRRVSNFVEKYVTNAEKRQEARLEVKERFQAYVNSVSRNSQPELSKAQRFWKLIRCDNWHKSKIEQNPGDIKLSPEAILSARQAKRLAPIAAMHVLSQLEELHAHLVHYFCQGEAKEFEVSVISKLAMHMQKQWDWLDDFDEWLFNVEDKLFDDLMTAHKWRDELLTLKTTFTDSNEMNRAIKRKLHELERVSRMSRSERIVWNSCMSRTEFIVVAPEDSPSLTSYILAWCGVGCLTIGMLYFLLSTSSELGKKQSALWLSHIAITGALTYLFIFPIEIYLFYVTIPNLLWDRIMTRTPGTLKKFPFMSPQPPYALRFLLELEPSLSSTQDAAKIVYGTAVRSQLKDVPLSISNEDLTATELAEILEYETWTPSPDTLFLLSFIGMYAALPEYFQQVFFEELLSLTPYMSAILTKRTIFASTKIPRRIVAAIVIVVTIFFVFLSYGAFELMRMIIRTRVRQTHDIKGKRSRIRDESGIIDEDEPKIISDNNNNSLSNITPLPKAE